MIPCSWKTDGSSGCEQVYVSDQDDGYTKIEVTATGGSPVNLLATLTTTDALPDSYWIQVRIVNKGDSVSVGVASPEEFLPGYKTKGMFYNGNLTNGSAALKTGYGPYLKSGDIVVLACTHSTSSVGASNVFAMTIYVNGQKIGRGFEIDASHPDQRFLPCLAVRGKVELLAQLLEQQPDISAARVPMHPLEGKWKVTSAKKSATGNEQIFPVKDGGGNDLSEKRDIVMNILPEMSPSGEAALRVSVKIFNNLSILMRCTASPDQSVFDVTTMGGPAMTMMMPPPPYDVLERDLSKAIVDHWQSFRLIGHPNAATELTITTAENDTMAHCVRFLNDEGPALTKYHH
ncbi:hypothetical protein IV203_004282 [Nitzschia inconspicua]|uniref:Uncharacterized protein n=1 Tax=Nitzschia inconspicua TaxID=303405 RepID=A0A9K3PQ03_9STRA|nr:hypothetical protein IV203_004282 [Nitzschia inconspicua]